MQDLILRLPEIKVRHQKYFGSKAVNLGVIAREMRSMPGFCLSAAVYTEAVKKAGVFRDILALAQECQGRDLAFVESAAEQIHRLVLEVPLPEAVVEAVAAAYATLVSDDPQPEVAVRSSATAEDLPSASFAGQMESFLSIRSLPNLLQAVKGCWASLWTARAIHYRLQKGIDQANIAMAVIIQVMVPAQAAGVMFTANPVTNSRGEYYIEAVRGLGEGLVLGEKNADRYRVAKETLAVITREIQEERPYLTDYQVKTLADFGAKLEFLYGEPQDVEWALYRGEIYILQTRPITTLADEEIRLLPPSEMTRVQRDIWTNVNERFPEPILPIDGIIAKIYYQSLFSAYRDLGYQVPYVDWSKVEAGFFPELFQPPAIRLKFRRLFKLRKTTGWNIAREWQQNEEIFNKYLRLLKDPRLKEFPLEIIMEYIDDALRDFQRALTFRYLLYIQYGTLFAFLSWLLKTASGGQGQEILEGLTAGEPQVTMELNEKLIQLAGQAEAADGLAEIIVSTPPEEVRKSLTAIEGGPQFLARFDEFLAKYGDRELTQGLGGLAAPTWREEPAAVWGILRGTLIAGRYPGEQKQSLSARRQEAEEALARLSSRGLGRLLPLDRLTKRLVDAARQYNAFRENSHFYLTQAMTVFRTLFLQVGNRLVRRGLLAREEDIMLLGYFEVKDLVYALYNQQKVSRLEMTETISSRRQQQERRRKRWLNRHLAVTASAAGVLHGAAASSGLVRGRCRVITDPRDFNRLEPGDILVARYTNPAWTPVFSFIGGLVVEYGSTVSHAAIIAREYGIPAVMGVAGAAEILTDGELITVDGSRGLIQRA